jgi:hypothetical protein
MNVQNVVTFVFVAAILTTVVLILIKMSINALTVSMKNLMIMKTILTLEQQKKFDFNLIRKGLEG